MHTLSSANASDVFVGTMKRNNKKEMKAVLSIDDDLFSIGTLEETDCIDDAVDKSQNGLSSAKKTAVAAAKLNENADKMTKTTRKTNTGLYKYATQVKDGHHYGALSTNDDEKIIEIIDETDDLHLDDEYSTSTKLHDDDNDFVHDHPYKIYSTIVVAAPVKFATK